jgi:hypothetical protein
MSTEINLQTEESPATLMDVQKRIKELKQFVPINQLQTIVNLMRNKEEGQFFKDKMIEIADLVKDMPKTYETDNLDSKDVKASLHYFHGNADIYIIERDSEDEQLQAYGYSDLGHGYPEFGYINLTDITGPKSPMELDLHFKPTPINEIKEKHEESASFSPG